MEIVKLRYEALQSALLTLHESFATFDRAQRYDDPDLHVATRDSVIKRFEYCIDTFWKFIKLYLEEI